MLENFKKLWKVRKMERVRKKSADVNFTPKSVQKMLLNIKISNIFWSRQLLVYSYYAPTFGFWCCMSINYGNHFIWESLKNEFCNVLAIILVPGATKFNVKENQTWREMTLESQIPSTLWRGHPTLHPTSQMPPYHVYTIAIGY